MIQTAAIAENPSVMAAAGWTTHPDGTTIQDKHNDEDRIKLAHNLMSIGEGAITAPTLSLDIRNIAHIIRHPVLTGRTIYNAAKDGLWFLQHPNAIKIFHGTTFPNFTTLKDSRNASHINVGLHVTPSLETAETFTRSKTGHILTGYIPSEPKVETIDIGYNNHRWLSNDYTRDAMPFTGQLNVENLPMGGYYDISPDAKLYLSLFEKYGALPKVHSSIPDIFGNRRHALTTEYRVTIPLRNETMPLLQRTQELDDILNMPENTERLAFLKNKAASDYLSRHGIKSLKYFNVNPSEGYGYSYAITDPNIIYIPLTKSVQGANLIKYPLMYEANK